MYYYEGSQVYYFEYTAGRTCTSRQYNAAIERRDSKLGPLLQKLQLAKVKRLPKFEITQLEKEIKAVHKMFDLETGFR